MNDILQNIDNLIEETLSEKLSTIGNYIKKIPRRSIKFAGDTLHNAAAKRADIKAVYSREALGKHLRNRWNIGAGNTLSVNPELDKKWGTTAQLATGALGLGALGLGAYGVHKIKRAIVGPNEEEKPGLGLGKIATGMALGGGAVLGAQHMLKDKQNQNNP